MTDTDVAPLTRAVELWPVLAKRAGLDEQYYDDTLIDEIAGYLGVRGQGPFSARLSGVSAQQLVDALLAALQPFAGMLRDLLALYETCGATQANGANLRIEYNFSGGNQLEFDLAAFREVAERWTRVTRPVTVRPVTNNALFRLIGALPEWSPQAAGTHPAPRTPLRDWIDGYDAGPSPDAPPAFAATGDPLIDGVLEDLRDLVQEVLVAARTRSASPDDLSPQPDDAVNHLRFILADRWPLQAVQRAFLLADESARSAHAAALATKAEAQSRSDAYDRRAGTQRVREQLDALPTADQDRITQICELDDLLSLPVWGKRHELYAAWVLTQIVGALRPRPIDLHVADGVLAFSFSGTHLATVHTENGPHELWAELRSDLPGPAVGKGRKTRIQPDYVLLRHPITAASSAVLVVECKQYRRSSTRSFLDALIDYANGHSQADVLLVNYGPVSDRVTAGTVERTTAIGAVRPLSPTALAAFADAVDAAVPGPPQRPTPNSAAASSDEASSETDAVVRLTWHDGDDLDLHLKESAGAWSVNYQNLTSPDDQWPAFARHFGDVTRSPGSEQALLISMLTPVEVWVHNFSNRLPLARCGISVDVLTPAQQWTTGVAPVTDDRWWHVCTIMDDGEVRSPTEQTP